MYAIRLGLQVLQGHMERMQRDVARILVLAQRFDGPDPQQQQQRPHPPELQQLPIPQLAPSKVALQHQLFLQHRTEGDFELSQDPPALPVHPLSTAASEATARNEGLYSVTMPDPRNVAEAVSSDLAAVKPVKHERARTTSRQLSASLSPSLVLSRGGATSAALQQLLVTPHLLPPPPAPVPVPAPTSVPVQNAGDEDWPGFAQLLGSLRAGTLTPGCASGPSGGGSPVREAQGGSQMSARSGPGPSDRRRTECDLHQASGGRGANIGVIGGRNLVGRQEVTRAWSSHRDCLAASLSGVGNSNGGDFTGKDGERAGIAQPDVEVQPTRRRERRSRSVIDVHNYQFSTQASGAQAAAARQSNSSKGISNGNHNDRRRSDLSN